MRSVLTVKKLRYAVVNFYSSTSTKQVSDNTVLVADAMSMQNTARAVAMCAVHFLRV